MRVLQLTQRFPPALGGVEEHVYHLAAGLSQAGIAVEVLTTDMLRSSPFTRIASDSTSYPFAVMRLRAWKMFDAPHELGVIAPSMVRATLKSGPDLVHAHAYGYFPAFAASLASALDDVVLVVTPHSDAGRPSWRKKLFDRVVPSLTVKRAARVIAISRHEAAHLTRIGVPPDKINVIPNGVDIAEFAGLDRGRADGDGLVGLFVGRIDLGQKGLETLVRAMALLPSSHPFRIRIVGEDWSGIETLRSLAQRLGIADRMTIVGKLDREALLEEYANAHFLVLPSLFEPFGIVLLEAMATGLPVVASRVGGIPEIVVDGRTGLLVEPGNAHALAEALFRISGDDGLRHSMGREARERVKGFGWDSIVPQIISLYTEALQEKGG